uniref:Uncharacterized protein n=1 Tax=Romanomermis culicivorax TaxID=13658 RepID=A0A915HSQ6_ROMCU
MLQSQKFMLQSACGVRVYRIVILLSSSFAKKFSIDRKTFENFDKNDKKHLNIERNTIKLVKFIKFIGPYSAATACSYFFGRYQAVHSYYAVIIAASMIALSLDISQLEWLQPVGALCGSILCGLLDKISMFE